jgi:hypothetical protein
MKFITRWGWQSMCNLYSLTKGQAAIRDWFRPRHDRTGNLPLFPGIFPDQFAPIVRNGQGGLGPFHLFRWAFAVRFLTPAPRHASLSLPPRCQGLLPTRSLAGWTISGNLA